MTAEPPQSEALSREDAEPRPFYAAWGLGARCGLLVLAMVLAAPLVAAWKYNAHGIDGLVATGLAFLVCLGGGLVALLVTCLTRGPSGAMAGLAVGMLFRMGLPLVLAVAITRQGGPLAEAGFFSCVLCFYMVGLIAETVLVLPVVQARNLQARKNAKAL